MSKVEIARSFAFKLNCGNYESRDFFCSQKTEVEESEAEKASEALYLFCKREVMKSVNEYKRDAKPLSKGEIFTELMEYMNKGELPPENLLEKYNQMFPLLVDRKVTMKEFEDLISKANG